MKRPTITVLLFLLLGIVAILLVGKPATWQGGQSDKVPEPAVPASSVAASRAAAPKLPSQPDRPPSEQSSLPPSSPKTAVVNRRSIPISVEQVKAMVNGPATVSFSLPDGRTVQGTLEIQKRDPVGQELGVTGRITSPGSGRFNFYLEAPEANRGPLSGTVVLDQEEVAFSILPGANGTALLTELPIDLVICRSYAPPPAEKVTAPEEALPAEHPTSVGIPAYQNGVIPLQSNPGVTRVVYLDFDGEKGPFDGWGNFDAAPSGASNNTIKDVWVRVCEDYAPFNVNITTDLQVFLNAPSTSRQRIIITPTTDAAPGAGGVAYLNDYGSTAGRPCWSFYSSGKNAAEVIAHEIGHTLSLAHDGRITPAEGYYLGHGNDPVGWAPIMGAGYYENLSQWSKGDYASADNSQDDLAIIAGKLTYRTDDAGADHATAATLEVFGSGTVDTEGVISRGGTSNDIDAFKFTTTGGAVNLSIATITPGPNLDISASLYDSSNNLILSNNPDTGISASLSTTLTAGDYTVRVDGVGRGDVALDGYSDYGSLGQYTITGTVTGAVVPDRFSIAENSAGGSNVGTVTPRLDHSGSTLTYSIISGNTGSALAINPTSGQITVATPAALNFESLSNNWLVPAALELSVTITDSLNSAQNETLRVVVTVTDVNETPTLSDNTAIVALSNTVSGTALGAFTGSDPDRFDLCTYSIVSGNSAGKFAINSSTGVLTVAGSLDAAVQSSYTLTLRATDRGSPALTSNITTTVTLLPCPPSLSPGYVRHTLYEGISGSAVSSLNSNAAFPASPTREIRLTEFNDTTRGDNYGSTIRAWMIAPYTGTYQFWISGDAAAELHFNASAATTPLSLIASLTAASAYQTWTTYGSQQSTTFNLTAGQICYLEARHKESTSGDHLSVAWQIRDSSNTTTLVPREVIPGRYLSPHDMSYTATNAVAATSGLVYEIWDGLAGTSLSTLTSSTNFPNKPDRAISIPGFTTGLVTAGDNYGGRIRAYLTPRTTGTYNFSIAGDDATSLLLSTDSNPANAVQIASNSSSTGYQNWTSFASQTSAGTPLTAGVRYYIEARVKEATGNDHVAVSWTGPNITSNEIIPFSTNNLSDSTIAPYDSNIAPSFGSVSYDFSVPSNYALNSIAGTVTASDAAFDEVRYSIVSGNSLGRFAINPRTGDLLVVNTLAPGGLYQLQISAQDSGHGGFFTPKQTLVAASITAPGSNLPPEITANPAALGTFPAGSAVSTSLAGFASDPGDNLTFALVSGPSWLSVSPSGTVSGTPDLNQLGPWTFTYSVSDSSNATVQASATLTVGNPPSGSASTLTSSNATTAFSGGSTFSGSSSSASTSDNSYWVLRESNANPSILEHRWTFTATNTREVTLSVEAYHTTTTDNDDFQFAVSTDGGSTYTNAFLITKTVDNNTAQTFSFVTGTTGSTIVRVRDTNRSASGNRDTLSIDALSLIFPANQTPAVSDSSFSIMPGITLGSTVGTVIATDANVGQTLSYSIPRGNEAGRFAISASGVISVNAPIPASSGPYSLIVVATDSGVPALAAYGIVTIQVTEPIPATITLGNLNSTYNGSPQTVTAITDPPGLPVSITYNGAPTAPSLAGSYAVSATITDPQYSGSTNATLVIGKASASISFGSLSQTYTGSPLSVSTSTTPPGLTVALTYDGSSSPPTNAGSHAVVATINDPNYQGSGNATLQIGKATASLNLDALIQTYDGSSKTVSATTSPAGLSVGFTYNGSPTAPVNAGSYTVVGTISDTNYDGSSSATLVIAKATATITLGSLSQTYNGSTKSASATTSPAGLSVGFTYDGSATPPTNAGTYEVSATISDANYTGIATGSLVIAKATASVALSGLTVTYDGSQKLVTATTTPEGLNVGFTYDGSSSAPTNAGTYAIVATVNDPNYDGTASDSLIISKATATLTLGSLSTTYDGFAQSASFTTSPAGLTVEVAYDGSPTPPIHAGTYSVVGTITDPNHQGSASGSLVIAKATASVSLDGLSLTYDGSSKMVSATTSPAGLDLTTTYDGSPTLPVAAGTYPVLAAINDGNYQGSASASLVISKASATVSLGGLSATYDGNQKIASASTTPSGLNVQFTYEGGVPPTHAGSYAVTATVDDLNYSGSASGTLSIAKAAATIELSGLSQAYDGSPKSVAATTVPAGLDVAITYNGSPTAPSAPGSYSVAATITDADHSGSASATLVITNDLVVLANQSLALPNATTTYESLVNEGTLIFGAGTATISSNAINHGVLRLTGDAVLNVTGTFTNTGVIDIINWSGSLPPGLINSGTILDRSAIRVTSTQANASTFSLSVPSYAGHLYQLETRADLTSPWQPLGNAIPGTGSATNPPALQFTPALDGPRRFYRVVVTPAP